MDTIHQTKIYRVMIQLYISQVMDSQVDSKTLKNLLENDMISLRGGKSDTDLLGPDPDTNSHKAMHTMKPLSTLMNYWSAHQPTTPQTLPRPQYPPQSPTHDQHHSKLHYKHH